MFAALQVPAQQKIACNAVLQEDFTECTGKTVGPLFPVFMHHPVTNLPTAMQHV
jgi:hypothetical protein